MADQDQPTIAVDTCSICLSDLTDNKTTLECGHTFHADCISSWFRSQHVSCPECRGVPNKCLSRKCADTRFRELQKLSRKKNAPKNLVEAFKSYKRKQHQSIDSTRGIGPSAKILNDSTPRESISSNASSL